MRYRRAISIYPAIVSATLGLALGNADAAASECTDHRPPRCLATSSCSAVEFERLETQLPITAYALKGGMRIAPIDYVAIRSRDPHLRSLVRIIDLSTTGIAADGSYLATPTSRYSDMCVLYRLPGPDRSTDLFTPSVPPQPVPAALPSFQGYQFVAADLSSGDLYFGIWRGLADTMIVAFRAREGVSRPGEVYGVRVLGRTPIRWRSISATPGHSGPVIRMASESEPGDIIHFAGFSLSRDLRMPTG